ncbi:hypothetical protein RIF29_25363 [Crotalaria pallida]|uniref:Uncharacterized protein n=1 Tax=Crotalaria pallida TaxID=3830 RepID=A0AAN9I111_CROPI
MGTRDNISELKVISLSFGLVVTGMSESSKIDFRMVASLAHEIEDKSARKSLQLHVEEVMEEKKERDIGSKRYNNRTVPHNSFSY